MLFELPKLLGENRKSGLTLAPEVATERMKGVINKDIPRSEILDGAREAFKRGWRLVKLYFMVGLPGESSDDHAAIVELADRISFLRKELGGGFGNVNATISTFVPKPHTPFQWAAQILAGRRKGHPKGTSRPEAAEVRPSEVRRPVSSRLSKVCSREETGGSENFSRPHGAKERASTPGLTSAKRNSGSRRWTSAG
ncbi:MAG: hypothetical protein U5N86_09735 [Planctomycetota bacterium]|nr:hypothetical protein [Planctomycetota bacterium]